MTEKEYDLIQWVSENVHPFITTIQSPYDEGHKVQAKYLQFMFDTRTKRVYGVRFSSNRQDVNDIVFNPVNEFKDKDLLEWIKEHIETK